MNTSTKTMLQFTAFGRYKFIYFWFMLVLSSCNTRYLGSEFSVKEKIEVMRCNTGRFNLIMGRRSQEVIRLCNLARKNPDLLKKYVGIKYGESYALREGINRAFPTHKTSKRLVRPLLRPSYLLWLAAYSHAVVSGFTAYEGHRGMYERIVGFGNFNVLMPGVACGENCNYGYYLAIDSFLGWMESAGHRVNIMSDDYYRIGIGGFVHFSDYRYNLVQCFSGPKLMDVVFRPQVVFNIASKK